MERGQRPRQLDLGGGYGEVWRATHSQGGKNKQGLMNYSARQLLRQAKGGNAVSVLNLIAPRTRAA